MLLQAGAQTITLSQPPGPVTLYSVMPYILASLGTLSVMCITDPQIVNVAIGGVGFGRQAPPFEFPDPARAQDAGEAEKINRLVLAHNGLHKKSPRLLAFEFKAFLQQRLQLATFGGVYFPVITEARTSSTAAASRNSLLAQITRRLLSADPIDELLDFRQKCHVVSLVSVAIAVSCFDPPGSVGFFCYDGCLWRGD
jgi:hypothetical protein